ncbi:hypothetical protein ACJIZ3_005252 [Penstemon smallii]|uniref:Uncharacterized protein n=1 Tax=Penstemon smallii TaxID=265156 RepID=A0ABD3S4H1_9LAMI
MTAEEVKLFNLDKVGRFIMTKALDNDRFDKIKHCKTAKEMWDKVRDMSEGNDAIKEHQLKSRDFQCTESRVFNLKPEAFAVNLAESRDFKLKPEVFAVNLAESRDFKLKPGVYLLSIGQSHGCSI